MSGSIFNAGEMRTRRRVPMRTLALAVAFVLIITVAGTTRASGQASSESSSIPAPEQSFPTGDEAGSLLQASQGEGTDQTNQSLFATGSTLSQRSLSSAQIVDILQTNPDLQLELKSQMADRMQQQGIQVDANDISDRALYNQISSNAQLRASITRVLVTRGYVSQDALQTTDPSLTPDVDLLSQALPTGVSSTGNGFDSGARAGQEAAVPIESTGLATSESFASPGRAQQASLDLPRKREIASSSTDLPKVVAKQAPFDLQSMRDLYVQIPAATTRLERFGADVFVNRAFSASGRGISGRDIPLDVPLGPDYVIGPGDRLTIELWGGVTLTLTRVVDRDGHILLPEAGVIQVAGLPLGKAQDLIEGALKPQYRNAQVAVTVSGLRSVRVYVVGDVQRPGGYDISSLATPLSALYAAGGPTAVGSLRTVLHYRGTKLIEKVDLYDFLLHGIRTGTAPFQSGDTLLIPPAGPQIAISGAVKRQAIYELKPGEGTLDAVVADAGGLTAAASTNNIKIERINANRERETVTLPHNDDPGPSGEDPLPRFNLRDGDRITVEPILPYSQRAVYLAGHVVRPGRLAYADGMRLSDVIHDYKDMLPEPAAQGEIVRLVPPDLHAETIDFNIPEVLGGHSNIDLHPYDTIRIFGRYQVDVPAVTIRGEVLRPGEYPMHKGMTAAQLVRMAGGFKRDALLDNADLTSYEVSDGNEIKEQLRTVRIGAAVSGSEADADALLKPGDILAIHQITNWENIGESVTVKGQVRFPGSYGFQDGERLSSVLQRCGGFLSTAYPAGAVLIREQVKGLEESSRDELIRQIEANSAAARLSPSLSGSNAANAIEMIKTQQEQVITDLKGHPPTGRMVIHISSDVDRWANTSADIELRPGDILTIPKQPGFVLITGQVYNTTALTFTPGKTAGWYLSRAGGTNASADRKDVFIIRANGSVVGRHSGGFLSGDVLSARLNPGDVVVVPQKIIGGSMIWRNLLSTGQLAASVAITAGIAATSL